MNSKVFYFPSLVNSAWCVNCVQHLLRRGPCGVEMGQDPVVLDAPCPLPTFCLLKTFSQRIILIREVRRAEAKENSKGYQTTIMQSLKKARAIDTFWAASSELLTDSESPTGWGRWLHDDQLQPSHRLPQSWELASKKLGTNWPWNWRLTLLKRIETTGWPISPWLPELTLLFLHEGPSLCIWNLLPTDHWGRDGAGLWAGIYPPPPPQLTRPGESRLSCPLTFPIHWLLSDENWTPLSAAASTWVMEKAQ